MAAHAAADEARKIAGAIEDARPAYLLLEERVARLTAKHPPK